MKAMILAAGEGTRLRPLTLTRPKPMLSVAGRPALEWITAWLRLYGLEQIVINLHYRPEAVTQHFGDGSAFGVKIDYSVEETILGTAGGAKRVENLLTETFVVVYGDVLTDLDLQPLIRLHQSHEAEGPHVTLSLYHAPNPWECGIVGLDEQGRVTRFVEKPPRDAIFSDLANSGVLIVDPQLLEYVPEDAFYDFSNDLMPLLLERGVPIYGQALAEGEYLIDIGTPEKYEQVQQEWPTPRAARSVERES